MVIASPHEQHKGSVQNYLVLDTSLFLDLILPWMGQSGVNSMKEISRNLAGAAVVASLGVGALPALAQSLPLPSSVPATPVHKPAPGPIAGASLPVLAVGFGIYWLVRRHRRIVDLL